MADFTPGPWSTEYAEATNVRDHEGGSICQMKYLRGRHGMGGRRDAAEVEANARLIAAAPYLLEALRRIESECDELANTEDVPTGDRRCYKALRNIARAALENVLQLRPKNPNDSKTPRK